MNVFGTWFDPPRGEGVAGQPRLEPIGEGFRVYEGVRVSFRLEHDCWNFEEAARV